MEFYRLWTVFLYALESSTPPSNCLRSAEGRWPNSPLNWTAILHVTDVPLATTSCTDSLNRNAGPSGNATEQDISAGGNVAKVEAVTFGDWYGGWLCFTVPCQRKKHQHCGQPVIQKEGITEFLTI